jgi:hypothetical protein
MNKETTTKPEIIMTDQRRFDKDNLKHQAFLEFCFNSIDYIQKETNVSLTNEDLVRDNAFNLYMKYFAELHKDNNKLNLRAVKLFDLMELNLEKVISIFDKAKVMPHQEQPKIEDYEMYATTPQEKERLKIAQDFLEILGKLDTSVNFTNVYKAPLKRDVNTGHPVVNHHWIKGVR